MTSAIMFLMAAFVFANKLVDTRFSFLLRMDRDINDQHQCNQREKSIGEFHCAPSELWGDSCVAITKFSKSYDMVRFLGVLVTKPNCPRRLSPYQTMSPSSSL